MEIRADLLSILITVAVFIAVHVGSLIAVVFTIRTQVTNIINTLEELKRDIKGFVPRNELNQILKRVFERIEALEKRLR